MHFASQSCTVALFALFFLPQALSDPVRIDDFDGDPITGNQFSYSPSDKWTAGQTCDFCSTKPDDLTSVYKGTWRDCSSFDASDTSDPPPTATIQFSGTSIAVYGIVNRAATVPMDLTFFIDSNKVGSFQRPTVGGQSGYSYNVQLYSNNTLSSGPHTLTIQNGQLGRPQSILLLDYVEYTPTVAAAPTSATTTEAIVEGTGSVNPSSTNSPSSNSPSGTSSSSSFLLGTPTASGGSSSSALPLGSTNTGSSHPSHTTAIIGGIIGSVAVLVLICLILWRACRIRRLKEAEDEYTATTPFFSATQPSSGQRFVTLVETSETGRNPEPSQITSPSNTSANLGYTGYTNRRLSIAKADPSWSVSSHSSTTANPSSSATRPTVQPATPVANPETAMSPVALLAENQMLRAALHRQWEITADTQQTANTQRETWGSAVELPPYPAASGSVLLRSSRDHER
ncbi:hypothetical protein C8J56DRAFT_886795 [Mycena floridula]|nr:hypothetical protein C8J56DRAFT_886795 [Mycena floridula]